MKQKQDLKSNPLQVSSSKSVPMTINSLKELSGKKKEIIERILSAVKEKKESAFAELDKAFDHALNYTEQQKEKHKTIDEISFFLSALSDVLNVQKESIINVLSEKQVTFAQKPNASSANLLDEAQEEESINHQYIVEKMSSSSEQYYILYMEKIKNNDEKKEKITEIHFLKQGEEEDEYKLLKSEKDNPTWSKVKLPSSLKVKMVSLSDFLKLNLPDYNFKINAVSDHALFKNPIISCYPQEKEDAQKVTIFQRLANKYELPEKRAKYARPILDLELVPVYGLCVRAYLSLAGRPRNNSNDKDIIQDKEGHITFKNVLLMNFGDPLRALTWVEDYVKNPEHGPMDTEEPIIRSFLLPLSEYNAFLENSIGLAVDADRAPGQVRLQHNDYTFKAVKSSLVSFMGETGVKEKNQMDGKIMPYGALSELLTGKTIHPKQLAEGSSIGHQHGRPIEMHNQNYQSVKPEAIVEARMIERNLAGFGLEPNSSIKQESKFLQCKEAFFKPLKNNGSSKEKEKISQSLIEVTI